MMKFSNCKVKPNFISKILHYFEKIRKIIPSEILKKSYLKSKKLMNVEFSVLDVYNLCTELEMQSQ